MGDDEAVIEEEIETAAVTDPETLSDDDLDKALNTDVIDEVVAPNEIQENITQEDDKKKEVPETKTISTEEWNKLQTQLSEKETMLQRQANEIGGLRRPQPPVLNKEALDEKMIDDPVGAHEDIVRHREEVNAYDSHIELQRLTFNKQEIQRIAPDFEELRETVFKLAETDGEAPGVVAAFRQNPYAIPTDILMGYVHRVRLLGKLSGLEQQIAGLKKKPDEVIRKIEQVAKAGPSITGGASGGASGDDDVNLTDEQIENLSDAELDKILKK